MKNIMSLVITIVFVHNAFAQVDTTFLYKTNMPYGTLDIRIAKSSSQYYYLQEGKTMSFRESAPGLRTDNYLSLLSWNTSEYTQGNLREKSGVNDYFIMNYRLLKPKEYNASYSPGYPILIMMHGLGERGNCWDDKCYHANRDWNYNTNTPAAPTDPNSLLLNNDLNLLNGGGVNLTARNLAGSRSPDAGDMPDKAFPGFVLFPQNLNGWTGNSVQDVIKIIRLLVKKYNIDEDRIYIEGLSNGGGGTFEALKRAPWLFACAITMSPISDGFVISQGLTPTIAHIPLWIFQGGKDKNPMPGATENRIKQFRDAGAVVRFNLYPDLGHGTWNTAFKEPDFFTWIRSKNKSDIHTYAGNTAMCGTIDGGIKMELANGFYKYQWQKDGVTIEGATGNSYTTETPGQYRARFSRVPNPSEADWNQWSSIVTITGQQTVPQANITQVGTLMLPDLNGLNDARLEAEGDYAHYYWFKDDGLIDFEGDEDDTLNYAVIKSSVGNGTYTLVTAAFSNCQSPVSSPKYIFFNNSAPLNINAPTEFKGDATSSGVKLAWNDVSSNENGFEIWSRKKISESSFSLWELHAITDANTSSYTDGNLEPLTTYQYKIRAVSNTGRSKYAPLEENQFLEVRTSEDKEKPSPPKNLTAKVTAINTVLLNWEEGTDNTGIRRYHVYYDGGESLATDSLQLSMLLKDLPVNTIYNFTVKAEDLGGNLSDASNTATASTYVSGLHYEHSTGVWSKLDEIDWSLVEFSGYINNFSLAPKTQDDYFNFKFDGYLNITNPGTYQFSTISSDGSRIMLDDVMVLNNDGVHERDEVREVIGDNQTLTAGPKRITVTYFEFIGFDTLVVRYKGPDTGDIWMEIPDEVLKSGIPPATKSLLVTVYPNPSGHNDLNLVFQSLENSPLYITLVDNLGRSVFEQQVNPDQFWQGVKITPPESLFSGLYVLTVRQNASTGKCRIAIRD
jgi:predicted esterase